MKITDPWNVQGTEEKGGCTLGVEDSKGKLSKEVVIEMLWISAMKVFRQRNLLEVSLAGSRGPLKFLKLGSQ